MLLTNATFLTRDMTFANGDLLVKDHKVYKGKGILPYDFDEVIDCSDHLILPGLFNSHFHGNSTLTRGIAKEFKIEEWCNDTPQGKLQSRVFQFFQEEMTDDDYVISLQKEYMEQVKNGVTFVCDSGYRSPHLLSTAMQQVGIRGVVDSYHHIADYHNQGINGIVFGSHLLEEEDLNDEALAECKRVKETHDPIMLTHCMENDWREGLVYSQYNKSSVELFDEWGLLDPKTVLYHGVRMNVNDLDIVSKRRSSVVHCPITNFWSGAGVAHTSDMLRKNVNVCLGTDWSHTDYWEVMRAAYYLLKTQSPVKEFQAADVFRMATINGARAFQLEDRAGIIEDGFLADLVLIKKDLRLQPIIEGTLFSNTLHNLLLECRSDLITHVMVDGHWILKDKAMINVNEKQISQQYQLIVERLIAYLLYSS